MAQFDVYRLDGVLVVDLQTDFIGLDETRIVAPLLDGERYVQFPKLTPEVLIDGERYIARVQQLTAINGRRLGKPVGNLHAHADELMRAMDILTRGF